MKFHFDNTRIKKLRQAMLVQPSVCVEQAGLITDGCRWRHWTA